MRVVSIRAYGAQDAFRREAYARMDRYTRASLVFAALNRWVVIRVNVLGTALSAALAWYLTYVADIRAADAGFSLSMAGESNELQSDDGMMGLMRGRGSCV